MLSVLCSKKRDPEQVPMKKAPEAKKKLRIRLKESSVENLARSDANASFSSSRFPILQTGFAREKKKKKKELFFIDLFVLFFVSHSVHLQVDAHFVQFGGTVSNYRRNLRKQVCCRAL